MLTLCDRNRLFSAFNPVRQEVFLIDLTESRCLLFRQLFSSSDQLRDDRHQVHSVTLLLSDFQPSFVLVLLWDALERLMSLVHVSRILRVGDAK